MAGMEEIQAQDDLPVKRVESSHLYMPCMNKWEFLSLILKSILNLGRGN